MVAREGIEVSAKMLGFTAFQHASGLSYPRCYPRFFRPISAIEPWTLNRVPAAFGVSFRIVVRVLGNDFTIFPNVNRSAIHARDFASSPCCSSHTATHTGGKTLLPLWRLTTNGHGPRSSPDSASNRFAEFHLLTKSVGVNAWVSRLDAQDKTPWFAAFRRLFNSSRRIVNSVVGSTS